MSFFLKLLAQSDFEAQDANGNTVRFLDLIKPFTPLLPEVSSPESKVPFNSKLMWTGCEYNVRTHKQGTRLTSTQ